MTTPLRTPIPAEAAAAVQLPCLQLHSSGGCPGTWKRILFVPTGAMLSKVSYNEGEAVPGIAHAVVIEHRDF